jgi:hypothetical protein
MLENIMRKKPLNPQDGIEARVDFDRAKDVAHKVIAMMKENTIPFNRPGAFPDAVVPNGMEAGSDNHVKYLFVSSFLDYRVNSHIMYEELRAFSQRHGNVNILFGNQGWRLKELLGNNFPKSIGSSPNNKRVDVIVDALVRNGERLERDYSGNPRRILGEDIDGTIGAIAEFKLFGREKAALYMKNMVRFGVWTYSPYEIPIKIDRHAFRIALGTEVVKFYRVGEDRPIEYQDLEKEVGRIHAGPFKPVLSKAFRSVTESERISAVDLNDGLWFIGSYLCGRNKKVYCDTMCKLDCSFRPRSEATGTYYIPGSDVRDVSRHLFEKD